MPGTMKLSLGDSFNSDDMSLFQSGAQFFAYRQDMGGEFLDIFDKSGNKIESVRALSPEVAEKIARKSRSEDSWVPPGARRSGSRSSDSEDEIPPWAQRKPQRRLPQRPPKSKLYGDESQR